jgi:hypothetical protein
MKLIKVVVAALMISAAISSSAEAACQKPVGKYVGWGNGEAYNSNGTLFAVGAFISTVSIASNGSWTVTEFYRRPTGIFETSYTAPAVGGSKHMFNLINCTGMLTFSNNVTMYYVVSDSGSQIVQMSDQRNASSNVLATYRRQ